MKSLNEYVYLAQSDTTVGLLSNSSDTLANRKNRTPNKKILFEVDTLKTSKEIFRVPNAHKNRVRRAKKTTFIGMNGDSFRVVYGRHLDFLKLFGKLYSTSANLSNEEYDEKIALSLCDVIVKDERGFFVDRASKIIKLGKTKMKVMRK